MAVVLCSVLVPEWLVETSTIKKVNSINGLHVELCIKKFICASLMSQAIWRYTYIPHNGAYKKSSKFGRIPHWNVPFGNFGSYVLTFFMNFFPKFDTFLTLFMSFFQNLIGSWHLLWIFSKTWYILDIIHEFLPKFDRFLASFMNFFQNLIHSWHFLWIFSKILKWTWECVNIRNQILLHQWTEKERLSIRDIFVSRYSSPPPHQFTVTIC